MSATLGDIATRIGADLHAPVGAGAADRIAIDASHDSRQIAPGWLYCAVRGATVDGHDFVSAAAESGAVGAVVERVVELGEYGDLPQLVVADGRTAMAGAACAVHGDPSTDLDVIGVTGTNGKSSIVQILSDIFESSGRSTEILGTLQGPRTTPEATDLQRLLRRSVEAGREVVAMEVSSHALELRRVAGTRFACAVFTNLGHDHLDFHETLEAYFEAKALLFTPDYTSRAVINVDDPYGQRLRDRDLVSTAPYGLSSAGDLHYEGRYQRL